MGESLERYAEDLRGLLAALDGPIRLVGASLGGLTSILASADAETRARVVGIVLVDVVPDPDPARTRVFLRALEREGSAPPPGWDWRLVEDILVRSDELRRLAAALRVPVTLVRGAASPILDADVARRFVAAVADGVLCEVPGAGHLVAKERPLELAAVLQAVLAREDIL